MARLTHEQALEGLLELAVAQGEALTAHGERLKKIEDWIMHNVDQGLILPPWKDKSAS